MLTKLGAAGSTRLEEVGALLADPQVIGDRTASAPCRVEYAETRAGGARAFATYRQAAEPIWRGRAT
ncbi:MAG: hypothetical protein MZV65_52515 [Chromatiales bacterium]|nr:hypothetical protein [Chromatiales bacterium]